MTTLEDLWAAHRAAHAARCTAARAQRTPEAQPANQAQAGPGTELRKLLRTIGIQPRGAKCKCNEHAREMDAHGPDWCEANIETILDWLEGEARSRPLMGLLFSRYLARKVVLESIARARAALTVAAGS